MAGQAAGLSVSSVPCPWGEPAPSRVWQAGLWPSQQGGGGSFTMALGLSQSPPRGAPSQRLPDRRAVGRNGGPCSSLGQPGPGLRGSAGGAGVMGDPGGLCVSTLPRSTRGCRAGVVACLPLSVPRSIWRAGDGWGPTALDAQENPGASHPWGPPGGLSRDPGASSGLLQPEAG